MARLVSIAAFLALISAAQAAVVLQRACDDAKHPLVILPGIMASQINASYSGFAAGSPCVGRRSMQAVWPPTAKHILPTGLNCWIYMVQPTYNTRSRRFSNAQGVKVVVDPGGPSGTEYGLWQSSYTNLTTYLTNTFNYTLGKDMFGAPFDWRMHLSGMERAGQMKALAAKVATAVDNACGKKAVLIGHSMGGLVALHLLHRDPKWTSRYIQGFISVSSPYGGTTDQAIAVRMGSVDFNINDWVKMPMARAAAEVKANHSADVAVAVANIEAANLEQEAAAAAAEALSSPVGIAAVPAGQPVTTKASRARMGPPSRARMRVTSRARLSADSAKVSTASLFSKFDIDRIVSNYISTIFYRATMGLPGLSMLLPYASAYGLNRRIIVTQRQTYTSSMMKQLMGDIGDATTDHAWKQVQELDALLAKGRVPGVPTYCMYAVGKDTTLTWNFPNINKNRPLLTSTPLVTTGGDGTVSMQSLKQCYRITDNANITELGDFGHLEVLKNPDTLQQLGRVLATITGQQPATVPSSSIEVPDAADISAPGAAPATAPTGAPAAPGPPGEQQAAEPLEGEALPEAEADAEAEAAAPATATATQPAVEEEHMTSEQPTTEPAAAQEPAAAEEPAAAAEGPAAAEEPTAAEEPAAAEEPTAADEPTAEEAAAEGPTAEGAAAEQKDTGAQPEAPDAPAAVSDGSSNTATVTSEVPASSSVAQAEPPRAAAPSDYEIIEITDDDKITDDGIIEVLDDGGVIHTTNDDISQATDDVIQLPPGYVLVDGGTTLGEDYDLGVEGDYS